MKTLTQSFPIYIAGFIFLLGLSSCRQIDPDQRYPVNMDSVQVHKISLGTAIQLTSEFKKGKTELTRQLNNSTYLEKAFNMPYSERFNKDAVLALLNQHGASGIRIYMGKDSLGLVRLILVGTDGANHDILPKRSNIQSLKSMSSEGLLMETGQRCPTICSLSQLEGY
ncbi:hypothetical protein DBR11_00265 [Pedobacter sp. HMWF019]|uniref:hypothetical protein n=1 Tax=Pedobacter sp. HMWF019 TaxID=2056856 RepID=UPI000D3D1CD4|nr:hypothetical protein [Pedobacter sp. HMWF019]PTT04163.1 hypothetical protein DBR11_00265 [Pedobacter sp. HMWF019]